jgi:hypothetical protein
MLSEACNSPRPAIHGFVHIATTGRWRAIANELFKTLMESGLYERSSRIFVGVVGPEAEEYIPPGEKTEVVYRSINLDAFEFPTLRELRRFCQTSDGFVYYVHGKGVSRNSPQVDDWRQYMLHFVVTRHQDCADSLAAGADICGVNWFDKPWPHFSGNFWWARTQYVRQLPDPADLAVVIANPTHSQRHRCERWIGSAPGVRHVCLDHSRIDHYKERFPPSRYVPGLSRRIGAPAGSTRPDIADWPIDGFMHVATMGPWREVVEEQLLKLRVSGLLEKTRRLFIGVVGPDADSFQPALPNVEVIYRSPNLRDAESPTLAALYQRCRQENCLAYYIHTKGVSRPGLGVQEWRRAMEHFVITRHQNCVMALRSHDVAGINWLQTDWCQFFAGNFWWARSDYIRLLPDPATLEPIPGRENDRRFVCERWIGESPLVKACNLANTRTDHYANEPYPRSRYARVPEVEVGQQTFPPHWKGLENRWQDLLEVVDPLREIFFVEPESIDDILPLALALPQAQVSIAGGPGQFSQDLPKNIRQVHADDPALWSMVEAADVVCFTPAPSLEHFRQQFDVWQPRLRRGGCMLCFGASSEIGNNVTRFWASLPGRSVLISCGRGLGAWYKPAVALEGALEREGVACA